MQILNDFNTTVEKALEEIDPNWKKYQGLIVCGTHSHKNIEMTLGAIQYARENKFPFLGICAGHQMAAVEYARNILGWKDATSEEFMFSPNQTVVIKKRPEGLKIGLHEGETYWNFYEVDYTLLTNFEKDKAENFITCQFHPEYQSSKDNPHPLLVKFLNACRKK